VLGARSAGTAGELAGRALILEAAGAAVESALRTGGEAGAAGGATLIAAIEDGPAALNSDSGSVGPRCRSGRRRRWRRGLVDGTRAGLRHNHFPGSRNYWRRGCADRLRGGFRGRRRDVQSSAVGGCRGRDGNRRGFGNGDRRRFQCRCRGSGYGWLGCWSCLDRLCYYDSSGRWGLRFGRGNFNWRRDDGSWWCHRCRWLNHDSGCWRCNGDGRTR